MEKEIKKFLQFQKIKGKTLFQKMNPSLIKIEIFLLHCILSFQEIYKKLNKFLSL